MPQKSILRADFGIYVAYFVSYFHSYFCGFLASFGLTLIERGGFRMADWQAGIAGQLMARTSGRGESCC